MRLIARYFGAVATSGAAAALKSARSVPPPEVKLGAQVARELHRSNTTQPIFQTLDKISTRAYNPATNQMRSVSTAATHVEALSPFDLQRFGKLNTAAVDAALSAH